jgi:hypothetical protein
MILTEIVVVMCTTIGAACVNYVDVTPGVLSISACEHAIQEIVRDHGAVGGTVYREHSFCVLLPIGTQNDRTS